MLVHEIITTERVPFTYRVAGMGSRFLAWLVDGTLIVVLAFAGFMLSGVLESARGGLGQAVFALWVFVLNWGYFLFFEWLWHGQTPGKRLLGIRVIQWRGTAISFYQAAVRNLLRVVDSMPWLLLFGFYGLGFAVAACNRRQRRLGDFAANTLVVHVERKGRPIQSLHDAAAAAEVTSAGFVRQRLGLLSREQKQTLLDLCVRRDQLRLQDRARLFAAVAAHFRDKLEIPAAALKSDEKFVLELVAANL
jgi:uncharacterized RDD family membrane protein YckC